MLVTISKSNFYQMWQKFMTQFYQYWHKRIMLISAFSWVAKFWYYSRREGYFILPNKRLHCGFLFFYYCTCLPSKNNHIRQLLVLGFASFGKPCQIVRKSPKLATFGLSGHSIFDNFQFWQL